MLNSRLNVLLRNIYFMANLFVNMVKEKCPFCGEGDVFKKTSFPTIPEMNDQCPHCKKEMLGEPGYYFGAMYVSYGFSVGMGLITFALCHYTFHIQSIWTTMVIIGLMIAIVAFKNYKWSRILWMKIFPPDGATNFKKSQDKVDLKSDK